MTTKLQLSSSIFYFAINIAVPIYSHWEVAHVLCFHYFKYKAMNYEFILFKIGDSIFICIKLY